MLSIIHKYSESTKVLQINKCPTKIFICFKILHILLGFYVRAQHKTECNREVQRKLFMVLKC